jgi:AAA+ superfamily predicted ATPase
VGKFSFGADWQHKDTFESAIEELAEGRLPGKLGLLQQLVGHWAIPKAERGWIRYGKASLDSFGSIMGYIESRKKVVDGGKDASVVWLADNDYEEAFPHSGYSFSSFVSGCLGNLDFNKKSVRDKMGKPSTSILLEFEIAEGKYAYYIDFQGNSPKKVKSASSGDDHWKWDGPFVKPGDYNLLIEFIRQHLWKIMEANTLLLSCGQKWGEDRVQISSTTEKFDFCSANDVFNDVIQMARRCKAFMDTGRCRNFLFYGPPGTGKSTLARAIARELNRRVVIVEHDAIRQMSSSAHRIIGLLQPGVLILNDVDRGNKEENISLLQSLEREHQDHALLTCLTVNDVKQLDPAILRPGRVHELREVPEPSDSSRQMILDYYVEKFELRLSKDEITAFMAQSKGFSPSDIREFCETALAVGAEMAIQEIERINKQRDLYAGDACHEFNESNKVGEIRKY